mmetsp:Transcript_2176/g.4830  ORF Transcript_2176/g.4830 Transcript_2176/m.4830 type:complete len:206 (+) Transcript_2176:394-1011(+)
MSSTSKILRIFSQLTFLVAGSMKVSWAMSSEYSMVCNILTGSGFGTIRYVLISTTFSLICWSAAVADWNLNSSVLYAFSSSVAASPRESIASWSFDSSCCFRSAKRALVSSSDATLASVFPTSSSQSASSARPSASLSFPVHSLAKASCSALNVRPLCPIVCMPTSTSLLTILGLVVGAGGGAPSSAGGASSAGSAGGTISTPSA